jgi:hypothetical protein
VLQRLLDCAEGKASEESDVEGYVLPGIGAKLARIFAAGLVVGTLAGPLAAPPAASATLQFTAPVVGQYNASPAQIIADKAIALGGHEFTGDVVSTALETVPKGFRVRYQKCDIYYSTLPLIGCHEVHGDIRAKYDANGGPFGHLGLPVTDELATSDGIGRYNEFSFPFTAIYWSPNTGPFEVSGDIRSVWVANSAESGRFGYPTAETMSMSGCGWQDFQNDVIYREGGVLRTPVTAGVSRDQMHDALLPLTSCVLGLQPGTFRDALYNILSVTMHVSDTGRDLYQSRNRLVTMHVEGEIGSYLPVIPNATFQVDLHFLFFTRKEADGSTSLWRSLDHSTASITLKGTDESGSLEYIRGMIKEDYYRVFRPVKLTTLKIPAAVPVLSFKVLPDGSLKLYLKPGGSAALVQLAVQREFDDRPAFSLGY